MEKSLKVCVFCECLSMFLSKGFLILYLIGLKRQVGLDWALLPTIVCVISYLGTLVLLKSLPSTLSTKCYRKMMDSP